jgi:hypothetical protein
MKYWKVLFYYHDRDEIRRFLAGDRFWADTVEDAKENAMAAWWDPKEMNGCIPDIQVTEVEDDMA